MIPYYDVQVNYNSRTGLVEVWMFRGGWHRVMAKAGVKIVISSDRPEIKRTIGDLIRLLEIIERNL